MMLVLTIEAEELLHIGDEITIQFRPVSDNEIRKEKLVKVGLMHLKR